MYNDDYNNSYSTSLNSYGNSNISIQLSQIPTLISNTFQNIQSCDSQITSALESAKEAQSDAIRAYNKDHGLFSGKGDTLDALQVAAKTLAKAQSSTVDGLKMCFDNQKAMAQSIQYLFALGCVNMAVNRTVVREIQMKLQNASREQLSELAKQELQNVILQLKAQEDLYNRIEKHDEALRTHDKTISSIMTDISTKISDIQSNMTALSSRLNTDRREINGLQNQISQLNSISEKINNAIKQIEQKIQQLEQTCKTLSETIKTTRSENKNEIEKLGNNLKSDFEKYVNTIKGQVNAFEGSINRSKEQLSQLIKNQERKSEELAKNTTERLKSISKQQEDKFKEVETEFQNKMDELANNNEILSKISKMESQLEKSGKIGPIQICSLLFSLMALISSTYLIIKLI